MIPAFIINNGKRKRTYNERTEGTPPPFDTEALKKLQEKKYHEWDSRLKGALVPKTGISYRESIEKNIIDCAIKNFLITFKNMLGEEPTVFGYTSILEDLDTGESICGASCPCPACASV